jgi:predicted nuclease of predicted toxin-antitoxin system
VKFLIDAQLPPLLADWLREQGQDADHVFALDRVGIEDDAIWDLALSEGYVVVTKDRDFVEWAFARAPAPQVLWLRFGNSRNMALKAQLRSAWPRIFEALQGGNPVVEAR